MGNKSDLYSEYIRKLNEIRTHGVELIERTQEGIEEIREDIEEYKKWILEAEADIKNYEEHIREIQKMLDNIDGEFTISTRDYLKAKENIKKHSPELIQKKKPRRSE